jgi:non-specific serine/threonine protein kinase
MPPTARERVAALFGELTELAGDARAERLTSLERDDPSLALELRSLLDADAAAGDFLGVLAEPRPAPSPRTAEGGTGAAARRAPAGGPGDGEALAPGARVGPYQVLRRLGSGGMATVWLAEDERLGRRVALKVLRPPREEWSIADVRDRFLVEARAAARLDHPHVAAVHDVGETVGGRPYIAMAYCEGGSLADRLAAGPLPAVEAVRVAGQVAAALQAAHARGIVHRDVKPANVLFDAAGGARLADFGIAKLADHDTTRSGVVLGTIAYLAPEQLRGEAVDHRTDLWALGVTLYEMLTARRPFAGGSDAAVLHAIIAVPPEPLASRAPGVPAALEALVQRLLAKDPAERPASAAEVRQALVAALDAVDAEPVPAARPPVAAPGASRAPATLASLVGRERELALAAALLERERLVTLTGTGGTGKTRLALELSRLAADRYADGVHVVPLASVSTAELVPTAVAQAVGLREAGSLRPDEQAMLYFARRRALLVLDNLEHVLDAAPFVAALLGAAPGLTVLATSREPLRLRDEQELPVPPLTLPAPVASSAQAVIASEAGRLFVQRARAGRPDFALTDENARDVAAICWRLDGLPLAIELAAARVKLLAPRALRARLEQCLDLLRSDARDVEPRHRTLRDVIDWSYGLLAPDEQALFRELSIFVGGFTLDAVARVVGEARAADGASAAPARDPTEVLDRVASLCDKSLLVRREQPDGEPRFDMLETVREYGRARLRDAGREAVVRAAHCAHFVALAEDAAAHLRGPAQVAWLDRLEQEHDNLRAAYDSALADDATGLVARLAAALFRFWVVRGFLAEGIARLRAADERIHATGDDGREAAGVSPALHASVLEALGLLHAVRSENVVSLEYFRKAYRMALVADDPLRAATVLNHLGWLYFLVGEYDSALALSSRALREHRALGAELGVALSNANLGWVAVSRGELAEAERHFEEALAIQRRRGDVRSAAYALSFAGYVRQRRGDYQGAEARYQEALVLSATLGDRMLRAGLVARTASMHHEAQIADVIECLETQVLPPLREIGQPWTIGFALVRLGIAYRDAGALDRARAAFEESLAMGRAMPEATQIAESEALLADVERLAGDRARAAALWNASLRSRRARGEALAVVECLEGIAQLAVDAGDLVTGAYLLGGAAAGRDRLGAPLPARYRASAAAQRAALEAQVGAEASRTAWADGAGASIDSLVARALAVVT